jgi:hypothetical protein
MLTVNDVIHGDKFAAMCDFGIFDNMEPQSIPKNKDIKLVFCKQDRVDRFFSYIAEYGKDIILVTHNADTNIGNEHITNLPGNVVHWFAQNVVVSHERITPIPIGLERPGVGKSSDYAAVFWARETRKVAKPRKRFLLSINPNTNPSLRIPLLQRLLELRNVTIINGLSFEDYLSEVADHEFVISPPGNGYDCHRTWEALYVGARPVVWEAHSGVARKYFGYLPVVEISTINDLLYLIGSGSFTRDFNFTPLLDQQPHCPILGDLIVEKI